MEKRYNSVADSDADKKRLSWIYMCVLESLAYLLLRETTTLGHLILQLPEREQTFI